MLPLLPESEYQELKSDIESRGLREAILVKDNHILDGRHRYRACRDLDIEPMFGFNRAISAGLINNGCGPRVLSIPSARRASCGCAVTKELARNQNVNIPLLFLSLS
jgi:hypothetical protein